MKDDLLIRFIDGKTTPEETEAVINELSQDGEAAKEWIQMVQGARLADTKPAQNISSEEFVARTLASRTERQTERRKIVRLPWIIGSVTAVAASVAIIATVFNNGGIDENPGQIMAEVVDSTENAVVEDTVVVADEVIDIKDVVRESMAETIVEKPSSGIVSETEGQIEELVGIKIEHDSNAATASAAEAPYFEMIKPAKTPYKVKVNNPDKDFVFEWDTAEASSVRLQILDKDGNVLIDMEALEDGRCGITAVELVDKGVLDWTIEAIFFDGSKVRKSGKIELVSASK